MINKLRVYWIANAPNKLFRKEVKNIDEAILVLNVLTDYDLYLDDLIDNNAGGLEVFEDGEWTEYYNEYGDDIFDIMEVNNE